MLFSLVHFHLTSSGLIRYFSSRKGWEPAAISTRLRVLKLGYSYVVAEIALCVCDSAARLSRCSESSSAGALTIAAGQTFKLMLYPLLALRGTFMVPLSRLQSMRINKKLLDLPLCVEWIALLLNNNIGDFALDSNAVQVVVTQVTTNAG